MSTTKEQRSALENEHQADSRLSQGIDDEQSSIHNIRRKESPSEHTNALVQFGGAGGKDDDTQEMMSYNMFMPGFSDDESGEELFDRPLTIGMGKKGITNSKKSLRQLSDINDGDEISPRSKKPRQSLFGGPVGGDNAEHDGFTDGEVEEKGQKNDNLKILEPGIRHRMSSMQLEEQDEQKVHENEIGAEPRSQGASFSPLEDDTIIPPDDQPVYQFRQNIDRAKAFTYIDNDKTGNYDPAEESRRQALKIQKLRVAKAGKKERKSKTSPRKEVAMKRIVRLRFKAFGNVRNYTDEQDNWPDGWSEVDTDCERQRQEDCEFFRRNTPGYEQQVPIDDPCNETDDLTGHPVARGCRRCREDLANCSMIDDGTYPCDQCEDNENECEPLAKPAVKGWCKQCFKNGQDICSFENSPEHGICQYCADNEFSCEALPPPGYKIPRASIDDIMYSPDRKYLQCKSCRSNKRKCSLKKKSDNPPCKYCKKHGIGCTFYDLPDVIMKKKIIAKGKRAPNNLPEVSRPNSDFFSPEDLADLKNDEEMAITRQDTPEVEMEDGAGNIGVVTKIQTSFAHPIQFSCFEENTTDCNFCELPVFSFVGHFERTVHVLRWHNGYGYTELGGGHCENTGPTTMCQPCTMGRAQILSCEMHHLRYIHDDLEAIPEFEETFAELLETAVTPSEVRYQLQRWCSMCFSPAIFACSTPQPSFLTNNESEVVLEGCGLRLCGSCEKILREDFDGNSSAMAEFMDIQGKAKEGDENTEGLIVRADVGFISFKGLLIKAMEVSHEGGEFV